MRQGGKRVSRGLAVAAFFVGFLSLIAAGGFYLLRSNWIDEAGEARGQVVDLVPSGRGYSPAVEFRPGGADHPIRFTTLWSTSPPPYDIGDEVPVLYTQDDPSEATIDVHLGLWWPLYVLVGIALVFETLGAIAAIAWSRAARRRGG